jgi:hypothetical protein
MFCFTSISLEDPLRLKIAYYFFTFALIFCLSLSLERQAHAYIDPGSGLLMLQAAGTIVAGALFTVRRRIKALFTRSKPVETTDAATPAPEV